MLQDIAMHILDLGQNSIRANAKLVKIELMVEDEKDILSLMIEDDGCGMDEDTMERALNPFYSSRATRNIGLGLPFMKELSELCNGSFRLISKVNQGTRLEVTLQKSHWDTPPFGDIGEAFMLLVQAKSEIDFLFHYRHKTDFYVDTREVKSQLADVSIAEFEILMWLKEYINENIN